MQRLKYYQKEEKWVSADSSNDFLIRNVGINPLLEILFRTYFDLHIFFLKALAHWIYKINNLFVRIDTDLSALGSEIGRGISALRIETRNYIENIHKPALILKVISRIQSELKKKNKKQTNFFSRW